MARPGGGMLMVITIDRFRMGGGGLGVGDGWCKHYYGADQIKDVVVTESRLVTIIVKSSQNN